MFWIVLLAACSRTPVVSEVSPAELSAGDTLAVHGQRFGEGTTARLETAGSDPVPLEVASRSRHDLALKLPPHVRPGTFSLAVEREGRTVVARDAVVVVPPLEEPACSDEYTANTELSLRRAEVVIDRYYRNGDRESVRLSLDDVTRVEFERAEGPTGTCNAVFLRTTEGRRVVFHDDRDVDLADRAYRIAQAMGKELEVVRPDGTAMSDDEEPAAE